MNRMQNIQVCVTQKILTPVSKNLVVIGENTLVRHQRPGVQLGRRTRGAVVRKPVILEYSPRMIVYGLVEQEMAVANTQMKHNRVIAGVKQVK